MINNIILKEMSYDFFSKVTDVGVPLSKEATYWYFLEIIYENTMVIKSTSLITYIYHQYMNHNIWNYW